MAGRDLINIVFVASASESDSEEIDKLCDAQGEIIDELEHQVTKERRRLLSLQMKIRSKKKSARRLTKSTSQSTLSKSGSLCKIPKQEIDSASTASASTGRAFLERGQKRDAEDEAQ